MTSETAEAILLLGKVRRLLGSSMTLVMGVDDLFGQIQAEIRSRELVGRSERLEREDVH